MRSFNLCRLDEGMLLRHTSLGSGRQLWISVKIFWEDTCAKFLRVQRGAINARYAESPGARCVHAFVCRMLVMGTRGWLTWRSKYLATALHTSLGAIREPNTG